MAYSSGGPFSLVMSRYGRGTQDHPWYDTMIPYSYPVKFRFIKIPFTFARSQILLDSHSCSYTAKTSFLLSPNYIFHGFDNVEPECLDIIFPIWGFLKIWLPLNHSLKNGIFPNKNRPATGGTPICRKPPISFPSHILYNIIPCIYIYTQITHMVSIHVVYIYISNVYINVGVYNIRYTKLYLYIYINMIKYVW